MRIWLNIITIYCSMIAVLVSLYAHYDCEIHRKIINYHVYTTRAQTIQFQTKMRLNMGRFIHEIFLSANRQGV